jgi:hypothetical protein
VRRGDGGGSSGPNRAKFETGIANRV